MDYRATPGQYGGLTWIELLISLAIIALVSCFVLPIYPSWVQKNRLDAVTNELTNAIGFARSQALLRGETLVLAPGPRSSNWSDGMVLFNLNLAQKKISHQWQWNRGGLQLTWKGFDKQDALIFASDLHHSATNGHFIIRVGTNQRVLVVNRYGRVRQMPELKE